ncbi:uncharacterized protein N7459_000567 [Penicillium hispanicum]|uniref:uncharacterized protein n=1 Tax=Penicillium hispanicum TaxID=1080232 RepID=UPI002540C0DA|nr:uncharacterized protein N7459_000567 [Penicillium hispanicum]KAJ5594359.1 hypothetical protein N7459_000567 [Penicillium hispanicum]
MDKTVPGGLISLFQITEQQTGPRPVREQQQESRALLAQRSLTIWWRSQRHYERGTRVERLEFHREIPPVGSHKVEGSALIYIQHGRLEKRLPKDNGAGRVARAPRTACQIAVNRNLKNTVRGSAVVERERNVLTTVVRGWQGDLLGIEIEERPVVVVLAFALGMEERVTRVNIRRAIIAWIAQGPEGVVGQHIGGGFPAPPEDPVHVEIAAKNQRSVPRALQAERQAEWYSREIDAGPLALDAGAIASTATAVLEELLVPLSASATAASEAPTVAVGPTRGITQASVLTAAVAESLENGVVGDALVEEVLLCAAARWASAPMLIAARARVDAGILWSVITHPFFSVVQEKDERGWMMKNGEWKMEEDEV